MQERNGARELGLLIAALAVLVRFVDGAPLVLAAALTAVVAIAGAGRILGDWRPWRWAPDRLVMPGLAAFAAVGVAALIDPAPWLAGVFAGTWVLATWIVTLETAPFRPEDAQDGGAPTPVPAATTSVEPAEIPEAREAAELGATQSRTEGSVRAASAPQGSQSARTVADAQNAPASRRRSRKSVVPDQLAIPEPAADVPTETAPAAPRPRSKLADLAARATAPRPTRVYRAPHPRPLAVRTAALGLAFLAFAAVGGFVPGGLAGDGRSLTPGAFAAAIGLDALIGGLIGARLAALGTWTRREMVGTFAVYAVLTGAGGAILRSVGLPRLFGPALLTLLVYVVTGVVESPRPILRNSRMLRETALLCLAGAVAIAWGLIAR